jgi:cobalamin biosynthesis protein CobT
MHVSRCNEYKYRFLSAPIERGGLFGVVGNGRQKLQARKMASQNGVVLASWFRGVDAGYLEKCESMRLVYFQCPTCN